MAQRGLEVRLIHEGLPLQAKKLAGIGFLLLAVFACSSCVRDVANRYYSPVKYPAREPKEVEVLWTAPDRLYEVIADFQSRGDTPNTLREKAAEIGADAVIVTILGGRYSGGEEWAGSDRHRDTYTRIVGTAIRYK